MKQLPLELKSTPNLEISSDFLAGWFKTLSKVQTQVFSSSGDLISSRQKSLEIPVIVQNPICEFELHFET